jgi:hypothetical protein
MNRYIYPLLLSSVHVLILYGLIIAVGFMPGLYGQECLVTVINPLKTGFLLNNI